jgi:hypothetical protein
MYDGLKAEVVRQLSGSCANGTRIELIPKQFKDEQTMENSEKHLTFYRSKNATLNVVRAIKDEVLSIIGSFLNCFGMSSIRVPLALLPLNCLTTCSGYEAQCRTITSVSSALSKRSLSWKSTRAVRTYTTRTLVTKQKQY